RATAANRGQENTRDRLKTPRRRGAPNGKPGLASLDGDIGGSLDHFLQNFEEFIQARGRDDDVVTAAVNVLGNAQKTAPRIFLQSKDKGLALDLNLFRF